MYRLPPKQASIPVAYRLYLPEMWANDKERRKLVAIAKLRWRIERDYEELKQELGLGHFEGRNWRGFHHHATLSIAVYGFLVLEQCLFPPHDNSQPSRPTDIHLRLPRVQPDYTPRGAAGTDRTA